MTLPKALSDPGCQLCQAQIIRAVHYRRRCLLGLQNPLISLGLGGGCKPALFSNIVIKKDETDRGRGLLAGWGAIITVNTLIVFCALRKIIRIIVLNPDF